ncbi:MAG: putative sporulation protein YtxC [Bacillota bacterium]
MAQCVSVVANRYVDSLREKMCRELQLLERDGIRVKLEENPAGTFTILAGQDANAGKFAAGGQVPSYFRQVLVDILSDFILSHWEQLLLKEIIRENYYYFDDADRDVIYWNVLSYIGGSQPDSNHLSFYQVARKSHIIRKLNEFLCCNNKIMIEGFIKFRLKDYIGDLQGVVDRAVDDFLLEREYQEFIQLLKYFVDIQEPRIDVVNVILKPGGTFKLFDEKNQPISSEFLEGFVVELIDSEINYEDLLISALITMAPKKIIFHFEQLNEMETMVNTIKAVFTGRVSHCKGCTLCRS